MGEIMPSHKPVLRPIPIVIFCILSLVALVALPFTGEFRSLISVKKVDDHPFYVMHYYGDYGFADFLKTGYTSGNNQGNNPAPFACTCFAIFNPEGDYLFGRNFDWEDHPALLVFTHPPGGYASVAMVDISYLGFTKESELTWATRQALLDAPYYPFDGMNEYGLVMGLMAVPAAKPAYDPAKVTLGSLHVIRLALDYARTVDEAVELFRSYNVSFQGGPPVHYLIADASGTSAVVEFDYEDLKVIKNTEPWQVSTNFNIFGVTIDEGRMQCKRYNDAYAALQSSNGRVPHTESFAILKEVSQPHTLWTTLYDMTTGEIKVVLRRNYDTKYSYRIRMQKN